MGMFDSLIDERGKEWQTKAFERNLDEWSIGDTILADSAGSYQVEILSGEPFRFSLATIRNGVLAAIDDERDESLLVLNYSGQMVADWTPDVGQ